MFKKIIAFCLMFALSLPIYAERGSGVSNLQDTLAVRTLSEVKVDADSCILMESKSGRVLYAKNAENTRPVASTTKIMTTLLTLESGGLDDPFIVDKNAIQIEGSTMGLTEGDVVTKRTLCYGMLLPSGNDAANAAAIKVAGDYDTFAQMMNDRAEEIGMLHTKFISPSGIDDNAFSTAYDMALLAREALKNPDFAEICSQDKALVNFGNPPFDRYLTNTNKLLEQYPGTIGIKTGFTDAAGRCLVSACEKDNVTLICVTLKDVNDWLDHGRLYDTAFPFMHSIDIANPDNMFIPVVGMNVDELPIYTNRIVNTGTFGDDILDDVSYKLIIPPFIYPPKQDEQIGFIEYYVGDMLTDRVPVYVGGL
ncbi:MAG: D-alanyl-D-alanine carboxypeptidase [Oscillospiraceae bacterium]|jgi:D-alanyl-D-alanine carboxypeptidase/D-alanyl-D-alanine carboxypeptidase (penicillin-binding protein 5/6)|nr:D-alanyl-D-alanine carboxypeptidase [Oscillospiraceae bacterium]